MKRTKVNVAFTHLELAADTLICFNQSVFMVHHDTIVIFAFSVVAESYSDTCILCLQLRNYDINVIHNPTY